MTGKYLHNKVLQEPGNEYLKFNIQPRVTCLSSNSSEVENTFLVWRIRHDIALIMVEQAFHLIEKMPLSCLPSQNNVTNLPGVKKMKKTRRVQVKSNFLVWIRLFLARMRDLTNSYKF